MKYDIAALISTMLSDVSLNHVIDNKLSNHSAISIKMKDGIPDIHIKNENDEIWIWSKISDYVPSALSYFSANLIPVMLNHNEDFFYVGQPSLYPINGDLELRALVKEVHLQSSDTLLLLLDQYLTILQDYRFVLS